MSDIRYNQELINWDSTIVEVGAHRGKLTKELYDRHGCRIIAIEPSITSFMELMKIKNKDIELLWAALGIDERIDKFYEYEHDKGYEGEADSLYILDKKILRQYDISTINLRTIFERYGLLNIDLLLLDCEGSEIAAINEIMLYDLPVQQICIEFHPQIYGEDIMRFMKCYLSSKYDIFFDDKHKNISCKKIKP